MTRARPPRAVVALGVVLACGGSADGPEVCGRNCDMVCDGVLDAGLVGSHLGATDTTDGRLLVSAYVDHAAVLDDGSVTRVPYGDVALGAYDATTGALSWSVVAGIGEPVGCPAKSASGFRGGRTEEGDDVGLFTQVIAGTDNAPLLTYYDATHRALVAARRNGDAWATHIVSGPGGATVDVGHHAKLVARGEHAVALFEASGIDNAGKRTGRIVWAEAASLAPNGSNDWKLTDMAAGVQDGAANADPTAPEVAFGSDPGLAAHGACIAAALYDPRAGKVSVFRPDGPGFARVDADSAIGVAYGAQPGSMARMTVDDACTLHVTYRVAATAPLVYRRFGGSSDGGNAPGAIGPEEIVDDGATNIDGTPHTDGAHLLADGALTLRGSDVVVAYQDSTAGRLRVARRNASGAPAPPGESPWKRFEAPGTRDRLEGAFAAFSAQGVVSFGRVRRADVAQGNVSLRTFVALGL